MVLAPLLFDLLDAVATAGAASALAGIAGILSAERNVLGMMPHPENLIEPRHGGTDGRALFEGALAAAAELAA